MEITDLHRRPQGRNRWRFSGVRGTKLNAQSDRQTDRGSRNDFVKYPTLWANVLGIFSQAPAHRRPLDNGETSSIMCKTAVFTGQLVPKYEDFLEITTTSKRHYI